jgi:predicted phage terminase large subunit-like protein
MSIALSNTLQDIISLPEDQIGTLLESLSDQEALSIIYDWTIWARREQLPPQGDWALWLIMAGRGFGKTRTILETVRAEVESGRARRVALIAETAADARDVLVEGESGILAISPPWFKPKYEPSKRRVTWPNGAIATTYSAEDPDQLRGPQHDFLAADEIAKWRYGQDTLDNALLGLRLGQSRGVLGTTPRPTKFIRDVMALDGIVVTRGSTYDNMANLSKVFINTTIKRYQGTRLGRQEIYGHVLEELIGALWTYALIDAWRRTAKQMPDLAEVVVGVDPAAESGEDNDETGIIVAGRGVDDRGYVLDDRSCRLPPAGWGQRVVDAYYANEADHVTVETNNGGEMAEYVIRSIDANIPVKRVRASRGKITRAEPIATMYEKGRVSHVGTFADLEDQMTSYVQGAADSPDRMDALVWALSDVMLGEREEELEAW